MTIQRIEEFAIRPEQQQAIARLLYRCFSGYPSGRTYYKLLPDFRYLIWEGPELVAHMAVDHRLINNDGQILRIFGVVDLCVSVTHQQQQLGSRLLEELESLGKKHGVDFIVLLAGTPAFYEAQGFRAQHNLCQWVMIHAHQTMGVKSRRIRDILMVKPLGEKEWLPGPVDFLGPFF